MSLPGDWSGLDIEDDLACVDGLERLEIRRQKADGTFENPYECRGVREVASGKHVAMFAEAVDQVFNIIAGDWPGRLLSRGDTITDECGLVWIIMQARLAGIGDQWIVGVTMSPGSMPS